AQHRAIPARGTRIATRGAGFGADARTGDASSRRNSGGGSRSYGTSPRTRPRTVRAKRTDTRRQSASHRARAVKAGKFSPVYPTAIFGVLLFVLAAMWYAASSQNSAAIYLLLFLLVSVFLVSIPHTLINLAGVTLRVESAKPTFAGDEVCLPVEIANSSRATRHGIEVVLLDADKTRERLDCIPRQSAARLTLRFSARHRGEHRIETLDLTSCYPLGFVRASRRFVSDQTYLVYPKPAGNPQLPTNRSRFAKGWGQQG